MKKEWKENLEKLKDKSVEVLWVTLLTLFIAPLLGGVKGVVDAASASGQWASHQVWFAGAVVAVACIVGIFIVLMVMIGCVLKEIRIRNAERRERPPHGEGPHHQEDTDDHQGGPTGGRPFG